MFKFFVNYCVVLFFILLGRGVYYLRLRICFFVLWWKLCVFLDVRWDYVL